MSTAGLPECVFNLDRLFSWRTEVRAGQFDRRDFRGFLFYDSMIATVNWRKVGRSGPAFISELIN